MKKNNAWKRKRQAIRNKKLKHKHQLKRLPQRSYNNLNANERSFYADDYALGADSPFYPKDAIGDKPVLKEFYKVESNDSRIQWIRRADKQTRTDILKRLLAGKTVSKSEMIYLRRWVLYTLLDDWQVKKEKEQDNNKDCRYTNLQR